MEDSTQTRLKKLGDALHDRRNELGLSAREVARLAGIDNHTYLRLERAGQTKPTTSALTAVADALGLPVSDLFAILDWLPKDELPSFTPYLRTKYHDMPDEAVREMSEYFDRLAHKYKLSNGPADGEDET